MHNTTTNEWADAPDDPGDLAFRAHQSKAGKRGADTRWRGHVKPYELLGVGRNTWGRHKQRFIKYLARRGGQYRPWEAALAAGDSSALEAWWDYQGHLYALKHNTYSGMSEGEMSAMIGRVSQLAAKASKGESQPLPRRAKVPRGPRCRWRTCWETPAAGRHGYCESCWDRITENTGEWCAWPGCDKPALADSHCAEHLPANVL